MEEKQRTLKQEFTIEGIGLHTGQYSKMTVKPQKENFGFKFKRTDKKNSLVIPADVNLVVSTERGTSLESDNIRVRTTEHILAALYGMKIDNALIELEGPEVPIVDGSAKVFVEAIEKVGIQEQQLAKNFFVVEENLTFEHKESQTEFLAVPQDDYRVTVMVDYNSPQLGTQHAQIYTLDEFRDQIAECRTFVFLRELESLAKKGLIKGGRLDNAIVMVDKVMSQKDLNRITEMLGIKKEIKIQNIGILNNVKLRYLNEPARHKLLDIIGDLALVGRPIKGHILAAKPGHRGNVEFAKQIKKEINRKNKLGPVITSSSKIIYDINEIKKILPHRYPFLLIDRVVELTKDRIVAYKNITMNETQFLGHFPELPVMPGVLQIEAMAQAGGVLASSQVDDPKKYITYLLKIDNVKYKQKVVPGDQLVFDISLASPFRRGIAHIKGKGYVDGKVVIEAEIIAQFVKKEK